jgi:uncharacterized protein YutE (UPF0331/DUF86 family)
MGSKLPLVDDVVLNKAAIIERCWRRVRQEYRDDPSRLSDQTRQDAIVLNLERACQAAIDLAMHAVARSHLGVPQDSAHGFDLLVVAGRISPTLARRLRAMVGFRNVAIHEYQALDLEIVRSVVERHEADFVELCAAFGVSIDPGRKLPP